MYGPELYTQRHAIDEFLLFTEYNGKVSDDHTWSRQNLCYSLMDQRAIIIQDMKMERGEISDAMRQVIQAVPMDRIDRVESPCAPPSGCFWARSITPIPTPIIMSYVADVEGKDSFIPTSWDKAKYLCISRLKSKRNKRHYLLRADGNGQTHLYVILPEPKPGQAINIPQFTLAGVFQDPIEVASYPHCDGKQADAVCNPLEVPFFTDRSLRPKIFANTWAILLNLKAKSMEDNVNNDVPDKQKQAKAKQ
jgi:hypothetical protein